MAAVIDRAILSRLGRGPADLRSLARWCEAPRRIVRRVVARLMVAGAVVRSGDRFDVPRAGPTRIGRGFRWPVRIKRDRTEGASA